MASPLSINRRKRISFFGRQTKEEEGSPLFYSPPGASSASPSDTPARRNPSSFKNTIPVILSDVDPKFNNKVPPYNRSYKGLGKKNNSFLLIGDTPRDVGILQSESKI